MPGESRNEITITLQYPGTHTLHTKIKIFVINGSEIFVFIILWNSFEEMINFLSRHFLPCLKDHWLCKETWMFWVIQWHYKYLFLFQTERSFQKQPTVFLNNKKNLLSTKGQKNTRHFKNVGLGFKTPREVRKLLSISVARCNLPLINLIPWKLILNAEDTWNATREDFHI